MNLQNQNSEMSSGSPGALMVDLTETEIKALFEKLIRDIITTEIA